MASGTGVRVRSGSRVSVGGFVGLVGSGAVCVGTAVASGVMPDVGRVGTVVAVGMSVAVSCGAVAVADGTLVLGRSTVGGAGDDVQVAIGVEAATRQSRAAVVVAGGRVGLVTMGGALASSLVELAFAVGGMVALAVAIGRAVG